MKLEVGKVYKGGGCPRKILNISDCGTVKWIHDTGDYRDEPQYWYIEHFEQWIRGSGPGGLNANGKQRTWADIYFQEIKMNPKTKAIFDIVFTVVAAIVVMLFVNYG